MTSPAGGPAVVYVVPRYPELSQTFVAAEARQVEKLGATVSVAAWHPSGAGPDRPVLRPVLPGPRDLVRCVLLARRLGCAASAADAVLSAVAAAALLRPVRAAAPDVLHAHFASRPTHVAAILAAALGIPSTAVFHARDYRVGLPRRALAARLARVSTVFAISEAARAELLTRSGAGPGPAAVGRIGVLRASCDVSVGGAPGPTPPPGPVLRVVTVARLVPKKGLDLAVRAVAQCVREGMAVEYRIVGAGPERHRLAALVAGLGMAGHVRLVGPAAHADALRETARADVALMLCRQAPDGDADGIPVSLMEAAALGVPVVSTPVGGIAELVEDGRSGILVPAEDVASAVAALRSLRDRPELRRALGAAARERMATEFDPARQAARLVAEWARLTGGVARR